MGYLVIYEDGEEFKADIITDEDKNACDSGVISIIDVETLKSYYEGEWHDIKIWGQVSENG